MGRRRYQDADRVRVLIQTHHVKKRSGLTRLTVRPLSVRVTGEIRTRDLFSSHWSALSSELQRHAGMNLLTLEREPGRDKFRVDNCLSSTFFRLVHAIKDSVLFF